MATTRNTGGEHRQWMSPRSYVGLIAAIFIGIFAANAVNRLFALGWPQASVDIGGVSGAIGVFFMARWARND